MVRTVKVRLELDRDDYKRGLRDAASETRGFDGEVRSAGKDVQAMGVEVKAAGTQVEAMGREVDAAAKKTTGLGDEADKARTKTRGLGEESTKTKEKTKGFGEESDKTKEKTRGFGEESDKTRAKVVTLAADIDKAKTALAGLGAEFSKSGQVNVTELDRLSRSLRELERAKSVLDKLIPGDGGGGGGGFSALSALADVGRIVAATLQAGGSMLDVAKGVATTIGAGIKDGFASLSGMFVNGLTSARDAITSAWDSIWKSIGSNPVVSTAIIVGVAAGLPIITATVSGALASAVNLGVGGGVLALGISRAVADTRVAEAWSHFADTATTSLDNASASFVDPLVRSARTVENAWVDDVMPHIGSAMDALAPQIDGLTQGVVGFLHELGPGFDDAVSAARPFLDILSQHLPEIGASISSFLGHLNNAGPGAEQFFHDILTLTEGAIRSLGWLVEKGAAVYEEFTALGLLLSGDFKGAMEVARLGFHDLVSSGGQGEKSFGGFHNKTIDVNTALGLYNGTVSKTAAQNGQLLKGVEDVATVFDGLAKKIGLVHATSDTLEGQMTDKLMGTLLGMGHATLGVAESLTSLKDTFSQAGAAVDWNTGLIAMNTQAGQRQREGVLSAVEANLRMYDAQIASGVGADVAATKYGQNTEALRAQLSQAGLTEAQIHDLIGEYGNVPKNVSTAIATQGLTTAIEGLNTLLRQLLGLDGKTIFTYAHHVNIIDTVQGQTAIVGGGQIPAQAKGGIRRAAVGMIIPPSNPGTVLTGEPQTGGEVLIPMRGIDTGRAAMLGKAALGGYGLDVVPRQAPGYAAFAGARPMGGGAGTTVVNNITIPVAAGMGVDGYRLGQQIAEALRPFVSRNGNSVQMAIVGRQVS